MMMLPMKMSIVTMAKTRPMLVVVMVSKMAMIMLVIITAV